MVTEVTIWGIPIACWLVWSHSLFLLPFHFLKNVATEEHSWALSLPALGVSAKSERPQPCWFISISVLSLIDNPEEAAWQQAFRILIKAEGQERDLKMLFFFYFSAMLQELSKSTGVVLLNDKSSGYCPGGIQKNCALPSLGCNYTEGWTMPSL